MDDGGRIAITGFTLQVVEAVVGGLSRLDWAELIVEPASDDQDFEKVDIQWVLRQGGEEHVQVKHSKNAFSRADVKKWSLELVTRTKAEKYRLVLLGRASATADEAELPERLTVTFGTADVETLMDQVAHRVALFLQRNGIIATAEDARAAVPKLVGTILVQAIESRRWTPETLGDVVRGVTRPLAQSLTRAPSGLDLRLLRMAFIDEFGSLDEYLFVTATFRGGGAVTTAFHLYLTDQEGVQVLGVTDGGDGARAPEHALGVEPSGAYVLGIQIGCALCPDTPVLLGAWFRRTGVVERLDDTLVFRCPLLPTPEPQLAEVVVVFPRHGKLQADSQTRSTRIARWLTTTSQAKRGITAVLHRADVGCGARQREEQLAQLYAEFARLHLRRPFPQEEVSVLRTRIEACWETLP